MNNSGRFPDYVGKAAAFFIYLLSRHPSGKPLPESIHITRIPMSHKSIFFH